MLSIQSAKSADDDWAANPNEDRLIGIIRIEKKRSSYWRVIYGEKN